MYQKERERIPPYIRYRKKKPCWSGPRGVLKKRRKGGGQEGKGKKKGEGRAPHRLLREKKPKIQSQFTLTLGERRIYLLLVRNQVAQRGNRSQNYAPKKNEHVRL